MITVARKAPQYQWSTIHAVEGTRPLARQPQVSIKSMGYQTNGYRQHHPGKDASRGDELVNNPATTTQGSIQGRRPMATSRDASRGAKARTRPAATTRTEPTAFQSNPHISRGGWEQRLLNGRSVIHFINRTDVGKIARGALGGEANLAVTSQ